MTNENKPECKLIGENGNIFNLVGIAANCLRKNDMRKEATEMEKRVFASNSYNEALNIIAEYVEITDEEDEDDY